MKPVTLYKKGCEPYNVTSQEALTFHLNQGWVEDPDDLEDDEVVVPPVKPYNVLDGELGPAKDVLADTLCSASTDEIKNLKGEVKSLTEIVAAKDQMITEMQTDFEDTFTGMNMTITRLKEQLTEVGLIPVTDVPAVPAVPAAPRKKR